MAPDFKISAGPSTKFSSDMFALNSRRWMMIVHCCRYQREQRIFQEVQRRYTELRCAAEQDGAPLPTNIPHLMLIETGPTVWFAERKLDTVLCPILGALFTAGVWRSRCWLYLKWEIFATGGGGCDTNIHLRPAKGCVCVCVC